MPPKDGNGGLSPNLQLEGFERVHLSPGQIKHLTFKLDPRQLSEVDAQGARSVQPGSYTLSVGGSQPQDALAPEHAADRQLHDCGFAGAAALSCSVTTGTVRAQIGLEQFRNWCRPKQQVFSWFSIKETTLRDLYQTMVIAKLL